MRHHAASAITRGTGQGGRGVTRLQAAGKKAVKGLLRILPKVRPTELKLMLKELDSSANTGLNKEKLIEAIIGTLLPGYPVESDVLDE